MSGIAEPIVDARGIPHKLRHGKMTDGTLTPACTCGWASSKRQHMDFERHIKRVQEEIDRGAGDVAVIVILTAVFTVALLVVILQSVGWLL